jgi:hypothetical protein
VGRGVADRGGAAVPLGLIGRGGAKVGAAARRRARRREGGATVKTHLLRIFSKLDVDDRTAAVTTAMTHGLI